MNQQELRCIIRESINKLIENIDVPINIGDTILGGKFKNKKIKVKSIEKNEKGDVTINGKPLLRFRIIKEGQEIPDIFYHGTSSKFPFKHFDQTMDGSGFVTSSSAKYGGFFFTSALENAEFYTEYFACAVKIQNIRETSVKNPSTALRQASVDNNIYMVSDILDGAVMSDVVVVPYSRTQDVHIMEWTFIGDKEFYFEQLDKMFSSDEDEIFVTKDMINEMSNMCEIDLNYLLTIPIFKEYYQSKH